jgi:DNA-binding CsgD family transcriptional regulator
MMLQRSSDDHSPGAAVARLTPKERECLARWLGHATAKEIALELGITHHAVEKRLKSARAKLGVTSTLEAARLLASSEGYGPTVSQLPEVEEPTAARNIPAITPGPDLPATATRRLGVIAGVSLMSLVLLAAAAFLGTGTTEQPRQAAPAARSTSQTSIVNRNGQSGPVDLDAAFNRAFDAIDKDRNGFLEGKEVVNVSVRTTHVTTGSASRDNNSESAFAGFDTNKDGRVSRAEFIGNAKADDHR